MEEMRYEAPATLDAAVAALSGATSPKVLAGGTDVLVQLHMEAIEPDILVDIKNIPELRTLAKDADGWRIGAAVPAMEMMENAEFCKDWPGVIEGAELIGSMQI
jgi:carbon-monoxide dehydrogenase medium subunit